MTSSEEEPWKSLNEKLKTFWDLDSGFFWKLREGIFDSNEFDELCATLESIPTVDLYPKSTIALIWRIPLFMEYQEERVAEISPSVVLVTHRSRATMILENLWPNLMYSEEDQ